MSENGEGNPTGNNRKRGNPSIKDFIAWERELEEDRVKRASRIRNRVRNVGPSSRSKDEPTWADIRRSSTVSDDILFGMFASNKALEVVHLIERKHEDYGSAGILEAPFGPIPSLITRLHDKVARAANLSELGQEPNHESLRDTFLDIAGYGLIGLMVLDKQFPEE
jgi:hypothetical protein